MGIGIDEEGFRCRCGKILEGSKEITSGLCRACYRKRVIKSSHFRRRENKKKYKEKGGEK